MKPRKIPAPLTVEEIPGGNRVDETEGKAMAYVYGELLWSYPLQVISCNLERMPYVSP